MLKISAYSGPTINVSLSFLNDDHSFAVLQFLVVFTSLNYSNHLSWHGQGFSVEPQSMQLPLESCWLVYSGLHDVMCTRSEIGSSFFSFSLFSPFDLFLFSCLFSSQASLPNNLTKALFCLQSLTPSFTLELKTIKVPRKELYLFLLGVLKASLVTFLRHYHYHRHSCLSLEGTSQRVYKGDLQNEWVRKPLWKHPKSSNSAKEKTTLFSTSPVETHLSLKIKNILM